MRQKENIDFVSGMKNSEIAINAKFISLGKSIAKINPNLKLEDLIEYSKVLEREFSNQAPLVKKELKISLLEQARTIIYYSESEKEMDLVIKSFNQKSKENSIFCEDNLNDLIEYKKEKLKGLKK